VPCFLRGDDPDQVQRVSHQSDLSLRYFIFGTPTSCKYCDTHPRTAVGRSETHNFEKLYKPTQNCHGGDTGLVQN
jgi:hypothetical protein